MRAVFFVGKFREENKVKNIIIAVLILVATAIANADIQKLYWANSKTGKILRANLDGSEVEDVISGLNTPWDIALDPDGGKIYWTEVYGGVNPRNNSYS